MASNPIRIGILGAGAMGAQHAAIYADIADVQVVGVFARNLERARSVAALCAAEPFIDAAALIQDATVDAIDVCLPSALLDAERAVEALILSIATQRALDSARSIEIGTVR